MYDQAWPWTEVVSLESSTVFSVTSFILTVIVRVVIVATCSGMFPSRSKVAPKCVLRALKPCCLRPSKAQKPWSKISFG